MEDINKSLTPALRTKVADIRRRKSKEIYFRLALVESGLEHIVDEEEICIQFGLTPEQLQDIKTHRRADITRAKNELWMTRKMFETEAHQRLSLTMALRQAIFDGDFETETKIQKALELSNRVMPVHNLQAMMSMLKDVEASPTPQSSTNVNIHISDAVAKAEQALARRRSQPVIEAETVETNNERTLPNK